MTERRVVIDTNIWISALIYPASVPGKALKKAYQNFTLVFTEDTFAELARVMQREKFQALFVADECARLLQSIHALGEIMLVPWPIAACRDPADNKILEAAVHGSAGRIVTGDSDLLILHPFLDVAIMTASDFLEV